MDSNLFYIIGTPRSGTTLLSVFLNNHSNIYIAKDSIAFHILGFYNQILDKVINIKQEDLCSFLESELQQSKRLKTVLATEGINKATSVSDYLNQCFGLTAEENGKILLGEKGPEGIEKIPSLVASTPNSKFIYIVRDPRATVLSLKNRQYLSTEIAANKWAEGNRKALAYARWIGHNKFLIVKYEDLLTDTSKTVARICKFLNMNYEPSMIDLQGTHGLNDKDSYVKPTIDVTKLESWKNKLSINQIDKIERRCCEIMKVLNYKLENTRITFNKPSQVRLFLLYIKNHIVLIFTPNRVVVTKQKLANRRISLLTRIRTLLSYMIRSILNEKWFRKKDNFRID